MNAAEAINAAGGSIVGEDGKTPTVDSPGGRPRACRLVDAYKNGNIPSQAITFKEEREPAGVRGRQAAVPAQLAVRVRPGRRRRQLKVKGKFAVAPLPGEDGTGASTLGGHNAAISAYSDHKATALDFLKFLQRRRRSGSSPRAPARRSCAALYDDPALIKKLPVPADAEDVDRRTPSPVRSRRSTRR